MLACADTKAVTECGDLPQVAVIILNWNSGDDTLVCLESLGHLNYPNTRALVVDNGSSDDSVRRIRSEHKEVEIIETGANLGYGGGNNVGLRCALKGDMRYAFLLNPDVTLDAGCLTHLVTAAEDNPSAAFLGPRVYHRESPARLQSAGGLLDSLWRSHQRGLDELDSDQFDLTEEVDYVIGAAVLVRLAALGRIGLLNPDFFLYREDVDWCLRARRVGYRTLYVPDAKVWHRSHQVREDELPRIIYYMTRNAYLLFRTNHASFSLYVFNTLQNLLWLLNWTVNPKWRYKRAQRDALAKGLIDALFGRWGRQAYRYGL